MTGGDGCCGRKVIVACCGGTRWWTKVVKKVSGRVSEVDEIRLEFLRVLDDLGLLLQPRFCNIA